MKRRIFSILIVLALCLTMLPTAAWAEEPDEASDEEPAAAVWTVTAFDALTEDMANQTLPQLAEDGEDEGPNLPETLGATAYQGEDEGNARTVTIDDVTWEAEPDFDPSAPGDYIYTPTLPEGYILAEGVALPTITVTVEETLTGQPEAGEPMPLDGEETAAITIGNSTWSTSTYAKTEKENGAVSTKNVQEDNYNIYWNACTATLTLNNASISVKNVDAISAAVETLTIKLIGKNTITAVHTEGSTKGENLSAISNSGEIVIESEGDNASLTVKVSQTGALSATNKVAGIYTGTGLTNSATLSIEVTADENVGCSGTLSGIEGGVYQGQSAFLKNSGSITIQVENQSLSAGSGANAYAVLLYGGALENESSGTLNVTVSTINGKAYGLRGTDTENAPWKNEGEIASNVTAYGGNYDDFSPDTYTASNYACAISIVTGNVDVQFTNTGTLDLTALNKGDNLYCEYAIGIEVTSGSVSMTNTGTIDIKATENYTYGIIFEELTGDSSLTNEGSITIEATADGKNDMEIVNPYTDFPIYGTATGIAMNTNELFEATPIKLELNLESDSSLSISTHATDGIEYEDPFNSAEIITYELCQAVQLQRLYYYLDSAPYSEAPQEINIANDLVILEGGEYDGGEPLGVLEDAYIEYMGIYAYFNVIGNYFTEEEDGVEYEYSVPSKTVIILPQLPGEVTITGTAQVGQTLTAETSGIPEGVGVSYQWQSCGTVDGEFTDIDGATGETYTLTSTDAGKYIRVVLTPADDAGYAGTLTATTTAAVSTPHTSSSTPTYAPTVEQGDNGTTAVSPKNPKQGDKVTITPKPDSGYEVGSVTVTDKNGKTVKVTDNGDGTYSFTQPASKVTVEVTFAEIQTPMEKLPFMDVPESAYYYDAVAWAVENGVTSGTSAITFSPDAPCTRAQAVTFLWRAAGSPAPKSSVNPFADVSTGDYYYDAVLWAVENGITAGTSATTFSPDDTCTRAQIVTFLYRAEGTLRAGNNPFADVADNAYYYNAVLWAVKSGVTAGTGAITFSPDTACTRAQIVTFLYRVYVG